MDTLDRESAVYIDMEQLERLVTEDDMLDFGGECLIHEGCRQI
jgi:hypothetical protein